jgi:hypothetical protein
VQCETGCPKEAMFIRAILPNSRSVTGPLPAVLIRWDFIASLS